MSFRDFMLLREFGDLFGGRVFHEEPGNRIIYETSGSCYSLPENYLEFVKKSIKDNKNYLLFVGSKIEYDPDVIY